MAKLPKKPTAKRLPKKPKKSASLEVWKKWEDRVKAVQKSNKDKESAWKKKVDSIKSDAKKKESLIKKYS